MKKKLLWAVLCAGAAVLIGGYMLFDAVFPKAKPLMLPDTGDILSVTITGSDGEAATLTGDDIRSLSDLLRGCSPTRQPSVNDYPTVKPCYTLSMQTNIREHRLFVYKEHVQVYVESPYEGVYKADERLLEFVLSYTEK